MEEFAEFAQVRHYLSMAEAYTAKLEDQRDTFAVTINQLTQQLEIATDMLAHNVYGSEEKARKAIRLAMQ